MTTAPPTYTTSGDTTLPLFSVAFFRFCIALLTFFDALLDVFSAISLLPVATMQYEPAAGSAFRLRILAPPVRPRRLAFPSPAEAWGRPGLPAQALRAL